VYVHDHESQRVRQPVRRRSSTSRRQHPRRGHDQKRVVVITDGVDSIAIADVPSHSFDHRISRRVTDYFAAAIKQVLETWT
jgi:hypothetical protein